MKADASELSNLSNDDFEKRILELFEIRNLKTNHTGGIGDKGVDGLVLTNDYKIAIQTKKYSNRIVNADVVRTLWQGALQYGANRGAVFTLNGFTNEAVQIANKLGVQLIDLSIQDFPTRESIDLWPCLQKNPTQNDLVAEHRRQDDKEYEQFFDSVFTELKNLVGKEIQWARGKKAKVTYVDKRCISHEGRSKPLEIDLIRWTVMRLWNDGKITRDEINTQYPGRGSSFCFALLSSLSKFQHSKKPPILFYDQTKLKGKF